MKISSSPKTSVKSLVCSIFGHHYIVSTKVTNYINEYKCTCCEKEVTNTDKGLLIELTSKQKQLNSPLYSYVQRRSNKNINQLSI